MCLVDIFALLNVVTLIECKEQQEKEKAVFEDIHCFLI